MTRATRADKARLLNVAYRLLGRQTSVAEAARHLANTRALSQRQAYRYLHHAQRLAQPLAVAEPKGVFTVKLPPRLIQRVRRRARARGQPISEVVTEALQEFLTKPKPHG